MTAKEIIERVIYLTVATASKEGEPWNTPVFGAYDESYNFYWGSHVDSEHSRNVRETGRAFLVIYDSTVPAGTGEAVYVQASARELTAADEIASAHDLLQTRRQVPYWSLRQVQGESPVRLYRAVPEKIWMNDAGEVRGTYVDVRTEFNLTDLA